MRRITSFLLVTITLSFFLSPGCNKDEEAGLIGTFSRSQLFGGESHMVQLQFTDDGVLTWSPVGEIPGHTASTVKYEKVSDNRFRIYDDAECGSEGVFAFVADKDGLEVTKVSDDCDPRANAMSGYWSRN